MISPPPPPFRVLEEIGIERERAPLSREGGGGMHLTKANQLFGFTESSTTTPFPLLPRPAVTWTKPGFPVSARLRLVVRRGSRLGVLSAATTPAPRRRRCPRARAPANCCRTPCGWTAPSTPSPAEADKRQVASTAPMFFIFTFITPPCFLFRRPPLSKPPPSSQTLPPPNACLQVRGAGPLLVPSPRSLRGGGKKTNTRAPRLPFPP
jgi:hypothetical protein